MRITLNRKTELIGLAVILMLAGCHLAPQTESLQRYKYAELHMGSEFGLVFYASDQTTADRAAEAAFRRVIELEGIMSDYDPQSELMRLCRGPVGQPVRVSRDLFNVLEKSQYIATKSEGAFDVTVGPFIQLWRKARKNHQLPSAAEIAEASRASGYQKMQLNPRTQTVTLTVPGMRLDLGGIGKGLAADEVLKVLRKLGIRRAMAAASGDLALGDPPPGKQGWDIGIASIDHPLSGLTDEIWLRNMGISTSGDTEQYVEINGQRYSHIVDPKTGVGLTERIGVTIVAPNATLSDSLTKMVSVLGAQRGLALLEKWPHTAALFVSLTPEGKRIIKSNRYRRFAKAAVSTPPASRDIAPATRSK